MIKTTKPKEAKMWMVFEDEVESYLNSTAAEGAIVTAGFWIKDFLAWIEKNDSDAVERLKARNDKEV